ncbi:LutC/YkgG family protein [Parasediminibacterium sp. JCM 36343]|uniref:LutC/YkgG family protein n=1 Tax=Parasediminibacterium sp. JCM 36343 TaxID=3374279 RepID=UPI00397A6FF0
MSREAILKEVLKNQPALLPLPNIDILQGEYDKIEELKKWLDVLHITVHEVPDYAAIKTILKEEVPTNLRTVTTIPELSATAVLIEGIKENAHLLENVELAIIPAHFGVAENGAMWITDSLIQYRVLPFITQQLAVVVNKKDIVYNMHQAYERIAGTQYDFGVFIAGPSKTADIEQSLVLGAHGPKGMIVFLVGE